MPDLAAVVEFWTGAPRPSTHEIRLIAARSILATKQTLRETLPAGLTQDPAVEILLSLFTAGASGSMRIEAACAATTVAPSVAARWVRALEQHGLVQISEGADGQWIALSEQGRARTTKTIDAILAQQADILA